MSTYTSEHLNADARAYVDLDDRIKDLQAQQASIKGRMRDNLDLGKHDTDAGVTVTISAPSRRFNPVRAAELLTEEQREVCRADGFDPKKLKAQLPPVLMETCMEAGTGDPVVRIS